MTMWTIQQYCDAADSWGVRVAQLFAPPPVTPTLSTPTAVAPDELAIDIVVTGSSVSGSGFFDPDVSFPNHISASITGSIAVNSITYDSPTQVTLNINTTGVGDGLYDITITNPDGQDATGVGLLEIDSALPVELSSFTAKIIKAGGVKLDWRTETEVDNYGFEVERIQLSDGSSQWEMIGFVEGNGNSNSPKDYSFTDTEVRYGYFSYRLKQIDTDGKFEYSFEIEINAGAIPDGFVLEQNYPNPFNPTTTIKFALVEEENTTLKVYDVLGNEVVTLFDDKTEAGKVYELDFNASSLPSGIYVYTLRSENHSAVRKMVLLK